MRGELATARPTRATALAITLLIAIGCAFHLPRLADPFGPIDQNAGKYFGPVALAYEKFGLLELRGIPMWLQPGEHREELFPYFTHPPGMFWLMAALGTSEAALRVPTVAGAIVAAIALLLLLQPIVGTWPAFAAGACLLGTPAIAVYGQLSHEAPTLAAGLLLLLATDRLRRGTGARAAWRALQVAVCAAGPWLDWPFAFFCVGLVFLTADRSLRLWVSALLVPAAVSAASAALYLAWLDWAKQAPWLRDDLPQGVGFETMLLAPFVDRAPLGAFVRAGAFRIVGSNGLAVALVGAVGWALLLRRAPGLALALLVPAATNVLLFSTHALTHWVHWCYFSAPLAAGIGALGLLRGRVPALPLALAVALAAGSSWLATLPLAAKNDNTVLRDFGAIALAASHVDADDGAADRLYVLHNFDSHLPYYAYSKWVFALPFTNVAHLAGARSKPRLFPHGYRYIWIKAPPTHRGPEVDPALDAFLSPLPRVHLVDLQRTLRQLCALFPGYYDGFEAWLVNVPPLG